MLRINYVGDDLHNFLTLNNEQLYQLYLPYFKNKQSLRRRANKLREKYRDGKLAMPSRKYELELDKESQKIAERASENNPIGEMIGALVDIKIPEDYLPYWEQLKEHLDEYGALEGVRIRKGNHTVVTKDADGNVNTTEAPNQQLEFKVNFKKVNPKWDIVTRVESEIFKRTVNKINLDYETCLILPDIQIPYQDPQALEVAVAILEDLKPSRVVFIGDLLDLAPWSQFLQYPQFAQTTQGAVITTHHLLARIRKIVPSAQIQVLAGNHEERLPKMILQNAKEAYSLKRADEYDDPTKPSIFSIPNLCAFDKLDVEYLPGYPASKIWLNDNLKIIHGVNTTKNGGSAKNTLAIGGVSVIMGHDHRISCFSTTINTRDDGKQMYAYGAGCLCRLDGHVPSGHQGHDLMGEPVTNYEDWSQGFVVVTHDKTNFHVEQIPINTFNKYQTMFRGKLYQPEKAK